MLIYIAVALLICWLIWKFFSASTGKFPPGPRGFRSVSKFNALTVYDHLEKYGEVSSFTVFGTRLVLLNSVSALNEAFKTSKYASVFNDRKTFVGSYIVQRSMVFNSPSDPHWLNKKKLIQEAIIDDGKSLRRNDAIIQSELNHVVNLLKDKVKAGSSLENGISEEFDIEYIIHRSLINMVIILMVRERLNYNSNVCAVIDMLLKDFNVLIQPSSDVILSAFPFLRFLPIGLGKVCKNIQNNLDVIFNYLLYESKDKMLNNAESCKGFIYTMLRQLKQSDWITDDIIKGSIEDIIGGANISTRAVLYSFFLIIFHYRNVQKKIQEEIDLVLNDRKPTLADKQGMPYCTAVIFELMRYATVAPLGLPHLCSETVTFRGYTIPKHSIIMSNTWKCHFGEHWDNPWTFKPERFLDETGQLVPVDHPNRTNIVLFGLGKRRCPGDLFAYNRIFLYVTTILQTFDILPGSHIPSADPRHFRHSLATVSPAPYTLCVKIRQK